MARNIQPVLKRCRTLGISPSIMGYAKESNRNPGAQKRTKKSEYALQLTEKQKVKFIYGVLERQFRLYYEKASKMPGKTGENLLSLVERRLDNVVFRLGFAMTRAEARQLVNHGHFTVDGHKVDIPSFLVKPGMIVALKESSRSLEKIKANLESNSFRQPPKWMEFDAANFCAKIASVPTREEIDMPVQEQMIVELYSK